MGKVRGVRFSEYEESLIEEFLRKNSLLDFSTLAKVAILDFIKNPRISLTPVGKPSRKEHRDVRPIP
ncbi:MAG: hypothetical protein IPJ84_15295 [Bdellovibrionales bacterium]|nr:hypothetical protein [Bdellovibrionales bacterium]